MTIHGTNVAKIIRMVCPHVEFQVAKIGQWSSDGMNREAALGEQFTARISAEVGEFFCSDTPYYVWHCNPDVQGQTPSRNDAVSETMDGERSQFSTPGSRLGQEREG